MYKPAMAIDICHAQPVDRERVGKFLDRIVHYRLVVSRGRLHRADELPALIAQENGHMVGLLTYAVEGDAFEVVTLHAAIPGRGAGTRLLKAAREHAGALGCRRLWLITTNDNEPAIGFYQRRGMRLVAVHTNALDRSRRLKPEIPHFGIGGQPIRDEIEFEYRL